MAIKRAIVLSAWAVVNGANTPQIAIDFPGILAWEDVSGQDSANLPPLPSLYAIRITCLEVTLNNIEASASYGVGSILAESISPGEAAPTRPDRDEGATPGDPELTNWKTACAKFGMTPAQRLAVFGATVNGRSRLALFLLFRAFLRSRPHA